ncbi:MAG TPA: NAD(P)H-dependent glycerol-3-phosphate dehydrogenase [Longimicrobiales bacterium]|nr:NAD(P)H-dependent glycerol-3-phosphate dehydrogenase [Longimicrobiales bacterium]
MSARVAVIGAGSWGTALANLLAGKGNRVVIWSFEADVANTINRAHENTKYMKGIALHGNLQATQQLGEAVAGADVVVNVTPSQHVRAVMSEAATHFHEKTLLVSASKGIETASLETMAEVLEEVVPGEPGAHACFLSGPSFALEVARHMPTAVTMASHHLASATRAQQLFQAPYFRVYTNPDVIGVELGGSLKNVIAIAAGMAAGLQLGHNALAALITRGLAEITRLGVARGANPLTFSGLAGMGDLILTCTGELSRNRSVGVALGQGKSIEEILGGMFMVAEGVETTRAAHALAQRAGIEMPIVAEVHGVLFEGRTAREAVENLMLREPKPEHWG